MLKTISSFTYTMCTIGRYAFIILVLMPDLPHAPVSISGLSSQAVLHKRHLAKSFAKLYKIIFTVYIRPANHIRNDVHQIRPKLVHSFTIWNLGMWLTSHKIVFTFFSTVVITQTLFVSSAIDETEWLYQVMAVPISSRGVRACYLLNRLWA